jgi:hypothetical protein
MKPITMFLVGIFLLLCAAYKGYGQGICFYATVRGDTVEVRWCRPSEINHYGAFVQRRFSGENDFVGVACFFSPNCNPGPTRECICIDVVPRPGIWHYRMRMIDLDGTITYTDPIIVRVGVMSVKEEMPLLFLLEQNYPNPFNPTTIINYQLPIGNSQLITLKVFDLLGREVATLVDEVQGSGFKSVEFDASGLASGVYFYRLSAGGFVATKKLMVIR